MMKEFEPGLDEELVGFQRVTTNPCAPPTTPGKNPNAPYQLPGPQVEFEAAYWLLNAKLRMPTLEEINAKLGRPAPYPRDIATLNNEIVELKNLEGCRNFVLPAGYLSDFINLQDPPFGAIFNATRTQYRVDFVTMQDTRIHRLPKVLVLTGRELARMFENETPGLLHRHAVNWLLFNRADLSPPRHARIWAALDLTISAALAAAWHFKWAEDKTISFRQRPWEYDHTLSVLYDREVNDQGNGDGVARGCPCPTPGTPRHPAYPSGHSTFSAAASRILQYFFRDAYSVEQLDKLADNIGEARLWAGVHWRTDHTFGQQVGRAVAEAIIDQLKADCVPPVSTESCEERKDEMPPTEAELEKAKERRGEDPCPDADDQDRIPSRDAIPRENRVF